jgi:hypothetical protein
MCVHVREIRARAIITIFVVVVVISSTLDARNLSDSGNLIESFDKILINLNLKDN